MKSKLKMMLVAMLAFVGGHCFARAAVGQALPDGKGKAEFVENCTACHRADMVTKVKKTPADWRKSVDDMAPRGSSGSKEDLDNVVLYLDRFYSTESSGGAAGGPTASAAGPAAAPVAAVSDADRVKKIIADNACLTCHRVEDKGAYLGPALNGVEEHRTEAGIRTAIIHPQATLDPVNAEVRLTTQDDKTFTARIVSQDDVQVQVIDAAGETNTYQKAELRQFDVIEANPMPSFEKKITGDDLDLLVKYLASLPPQ